MVATSSTSTTSKSTSSSEPQPAPSRLGPWELVRLVGEGRLASVHAARPSDGSADEPASYAIKLLRGEWQEDVRGRALLRARRT